MTKKTKTYKVVGRTSCEFTLSSDKTHYKWAREIQEIYDLYHLDVEHIINVWINYSDNYYSAGWIAHSKEDVERAFGVVLEETYVGE